MNHLDYYRQQATARGVTTKDDILRLTDEQSYLFDRILSAWMPADRTTPWVDLACGHGSFLVYLQRKGWSDLRGVELSPEQVKLARSTGLDIRQEDALSWLANQPSASLSMISAIDFIEHLSKDDLMELLANACKALKVGGRLILRYPNADSPLVGLHLFNDITHTWTYTTNCMRSLARMHGFHSVMFLDEGFHAIRDHRWLKVPFGRLAAAALGMLYRGASRVPIHYWSPDIWACIEK